MAQTDTSRSLRTLPEFDVSRSDICRALAISRRTSYRYEEAGYLPRGVRVGPGIVRWARRDVEALLQRLAADRG